MKADDYRFIFLLTVMLSACFQVGAQTEKHALLMGIGNYQHFNNLEGPKYDIEAMEETLISYWDFDKKNIHVLSEADANLGRLTGELKKLVEVSKPGDVVFIYYSGHGTSSAAPRGRRVKVELPACSGALIPANFSFGDPVEVQSQKLIIGRRDLFPWVKQMDDSGVRVFMAFDTCFSANAYRGAASGSVTGNPDLDSRFQSPKGNPLADADDEVSSQQHQHCNSPYKNVFYLGGASANAEAADIKTSMLGTYNTYDNKPHGAMTHAMLRIMRGDFNADFNGKDGLQYMELYSGVKTLLERGKFGQTPTYAPLLDDTTKQVVHSTLFENQRGFTAAVPLHKIGPLRVRLNSTNPELRARIKRIQGIQLVDHHSDVAIVETAGDYRLFSGDGSLISGVVRVPAEGIVNALRQQVWIDKFMRRSPGTAAFSFLLSRKGTTSETIGVGDDLEFSLATGQAAQLLVLNLEPAGGVSVLYPWDRCEGAMTKSGEIRSIPECGVPIKVPGPDQGGKAGTDYVLAFAFVGTTPLVDKLKQKSKQRAAAGDMWMRWDEPVLQEFAEYLSTHGDQYRSAKLELKSH